MEKNKEYYKNLFLKYKELKEKTTLKAEDVNEKSGEIKPINISGKDIIERAVIERELSEGLTFLSDEELIEISGIGFFSMKAREILLNRRMNQ